MQRCCIQLRYPSMRLAGTWIAVDASKMALKALQAEAMKPEQRPRMWICKLEAQRFGIGTGAAVSSATEGNPPPLPSTYQVEQLLEGMTPEAMHQALDWDEWDRDAGRESAGHAATGPDVSAS